MPDLFGSLRYQSVSRGALHANRDFSHRGLFLLAGLLTAAGLTGSRGRGNSISMATPFADHRSQADGDAFDRLVTWPAAGPSDIQDGKIQGAAFPSLS